MAKLLPTGRMPGQWLPSTLGQASESSWRRLVWLPLIQIAELSTIPQTTLNTHNLNVKP